MITGERRRRRWTSEEKARIAAESFEEGANISEGARRNGVSRRLLTVGRRQAAAALAGKARTSCLSKLAPRAMAGGLASPSVFRRYRRSPWRLRRRRPRSVEWSRSR
ncbi:transposase [Bradyrhizobium tropiciagri]|uniref:transposase n=1 Tax=Bradyrhizobium tropiciagri TaxID=312253 RepID=UPI001009AA02|nr:transposase [Bradyrhizobium tropiciagri]